MSFNLNTEPGAAAAAEYNGVNAQATDGLFRAPSTGIWDMDAEIVYFLRYQVFLKKKLEH